MNNNPTDYDYNDQSKDTEDVVTPADNVGEEATQAELNPAYYPAAAKPEALQNEAEKQGAEFPGGTQLDAAVAAQDEAEPEPEPEPAKAEPGNDEPKARRFSRKDSS